MKLFYYTIFWVMLCSSLAHAMMVAIQDDSSSNRFLGLDAPYCATSVVGDNGEQAYECGLLFDATALTGSYVNGSDLLLGVNFLDPAFSSKMMVMFNQFGYWQSSQAPVVAKLKDEGKTQDEINQVVPAQGVFMIIFLSGQLALDYAMQQNIQIPVRVEQGSYCAQGDQLLMAVLKFNDGTQIYTWAVDAVCLSSSAQFKLHISVAQDSSVSAQLRGSAYANAVQSPRSLKIELL